MNNCGKKKREHWNNFEGTMRKSFWIKAGLTKLQGCHCCVEWLPHSPLLEDSIQSDHRGHRNLQSELKGGGFSVISTSFKKADSFYIWFAAVKNNATFKGLVVLPPKMKSLVTHSHFGLNLYAFISSADKKRRYFE